MTYRGTGFSNENEEWYEFEVLSADINGPKSTLHWREVVGTEAKLEAFATDGEFFEGRYSYTDYKEANEPGSVGLRMFVAKNGEVVLFGWFTPDGGRKGPLGFHLYPSAG